MLLLLPPQLLLQLLVLVVRLDQRLEGKVHLLLGLQRVLLEIRERLFELAELGEGVHELTLSLQVLALLVGLHHTHLKLDTLKYILGTFLIETELVDICEFRTGPFYRTF